MQIVWVFQFCGTQTVQIVQSRTRRASGCRCIDAGCGRQYAQSCGGLEVHRLWLFSKLCGGTSSFPPSAFPLVLVLCVWRLLFFFHSLTFTVGLAPFRSTQRTSCKKCNVPKPAGGVPAGGDIGGKAIVPTISAVVAVATASGGLRAGDWLCVCGYHNYRSRDRCHSCAEPQPKGSAVSVSGDGKLGGKGGGGLHPGDWVCASCQYTNYASRDQVRAGRRVDSVLCVCVCP